MSADADQALADPGRLEQAVGNLVANALRHTPSGGTSSSRPRFRGDGTASPSSDSGDGIPAAHLAHVFDRFYKADSARSGGHGGSGLGLSIVKAIVERHGGTIAVDSRPGRTAFEILLPHAAAGVAPPGVSRRRRRTCSRRPTP